MIKWMISSSCLILMMIGVRRLFKGKISPRLQYALWILVAIRLLVPVNLGNSVLSIENYTNQLTIQKQEEVHEKTAIQEDFNNASDRIKVFDSIETFNTNQSLESNYNETHTLPYEDVISAKSASQIDVAKLLFYVWIVGASIVTLVFISSNIVFWKRVRTTRILLENAVEKLPVYVSSAVETPCLFGIIHPGIYVTNTVAEEEKTLRHAVTHELTHYTQGDLWWSLIRCFCLTLHWYNPLVWWSAKLSKQDAELACDEATIRKLGEEERLDYGKTLIRLTCEKRQVWFVAATTMTSDQKSIKERIGRIAKKTKVTFYALLGVLIISMIAVGCTFTGAKKKELNESSVTAPVRGIPCVNPQDAGWDLKNVTDIRENFTEIYHTSDEGRENNTYLLCELDNHHMLYGKGDFQTMLLQKDGKYAEIEFPYASNYCVLPQLMEEDIDEDGQTELMIWIYLQHGTGLHLENLLLADLNKDDQLYVYEFTWENCEELLSEVLSCEISQEGIQPLVNNQPAGKMQPHLEAEESFKGVSVGNSLNFIYDNWTGEMILSGEIMLLLESDPAGLYGNGNDVTATVQWDGRQFDLTNFTSKNSRVEELITQTLLKKYEVESFYGIKIKYDSTKMNEDTLVVSVEVLPEKMDSKIDHLDVHLIKAKDIYSESGWAIDRIIGDAASKASRIIEKVNANLREGYVDAKLTYVDNAEVGWNFYSDNPWSTDAERDALAQAALKELYTLTGYNVTECTYTTDGRSRFIFGKSGEYIKKCIAFYSRDYGFALCGDSVPYQGYMNARRFHYSDVQQLVSPLETGMEEYEGGLSKWCLEHSGVYQGEKIIGYEEINKDDTVYIHVKLMFDGGYYIVVIDKAIESCSEVMGPYYESRHKSELTEQREFTYYNEAQKDKVCLAVMPDGVSKAGGDYKYIVPENQEKWIKSYNEMYAVASDDGHWIEDERSRGIWIVYKDEWTCMTDQGFIVDFEKRTEVSDAQEFYELCLNEAKKHGINEPIRPEEMKNFVQATLALENKMYLLTDEKSLFELQKAFSSSQEIRGGAGCPFTAELCFKTKEGEMINISLATDSCNTWLSSGVYYQYSGFDDIEELRSYFNEHGTDISSALDIYRGNISMGDYKEENLNGYILADSWANAFVNKKLETIVKLANEDVIEQMIEYELMDKDRTTFGWSSPWPGLFTEESYQVINCDDQGAEILYYASLSTPHVVVWRETLEFAGGKISAWDLQCYENISTIDDYMNAYPQNQITNTPMDYNTNGLGQVLNENALLSSSQAYKQLFDARTAALDLLNISRSFELEHYYVEETETGTVVSIPFLNRDGSTDRVMVTMWQPYGKDGIWIPKSN